MGRHPTPAALVPQGSCRQPVACIPAGASAWQREHWPCGAQVLVEGAAKRSPWLLTGRTCHNKRVVFPADGTIPASLAAAQAGAAAAGLAQRPGRRVRATRRAGPLSRVASAGARGRAAEGGGLRGGAGAARGRAVAGGAAPLARTSAAEFVARFGSALPGGAARDGLRVTRRALAA